MNKNLIGLLPFLSWILFISDVSVFSQNPGLSETKGGSVHFAIALAQPEEAKTVAWLNAAALWQGESFPGYGFGEWTWPPGLLQLVLKNPEREDFNLKLTATAGDCYLLGVDSAPNPDPKKKEKYPKITMATCVPIKATKPEHEPYVYGVSFIREPLNLEVNGKPITLKYSEPVLFSKGLAMIKEKGEILTSSDPQDLCIIAWAFFKSAEGKVYAINSRFY